MTVPIARSGPLLCDARCYFYQRKIHLVGNVGLGQLACQHGLHNFHAGFGCHLFGPGQIRFATAIGHAFGDGCLLFCPQFQGFFRGDSRFAGLNIAYAMIAASIIL
jgi:hypothetical protein